MHNHLHSDRASCQRLSSVLNATLDILLPVKLYHINSKIPGHTDSWFVYYDASYHYFSKDHLLYALNSSLLFFVFSLCPITLLIVYPMLCFQRYIRANNYALRTLVDAFQGNYKDGTEPGTRDCHWFAGIYILLRSNYMILESMLSLEQ